MQQKKIEEESKQVAVYMEWSGERVKKRKNKRKSKCNNGERWKTESAHSSSHMQKSKNAQDKTKRTHGKQINNNSV